MKQTIKSGSSNSKLYNNTTPYTLNHDINHLLSCFNELDRNKTGLISKQSAKIFFRSIHATNYQNYLLSNSNAYEFDHVLAILGFIECPSQPSIYVLTFIKLLAQFRNNCLKKDQTQSLIQANEIDQKIRNIIAKQLDRQAVRISIQNKRVFEEMQLNQERHFKVFQDQWNLYIGDYENQTKRKISQRVEMRNRFLDHEQSRFVKTARRYSVLTSTKLIELEQRKKRLVKQGKYNEALLIKQKINTQKQRISEQQKTQTSFIATKRFQSLDKKKQSILATNLMTANNNVQKLYKKKEEGQQIMKIRMKSIRQDTLKKLSSNVKMQISRLKSLFYQASKG